MAKVLVAEHELETRDALERALRDWGYEVVAVDDGFQAVRELLVDPEIRLALVDRELGGMDGLEVCRVIQGLDRFVYAILMSSEAPDPTRAREAGASECVRKPPELDELLAVVEEGRRRTGEGS